MKMKKRIRKKAMSVICILLCVVMFTFSGGIHSRAEESGVSSLALECTSAVLMEAQTGQILYASNEDQALPPASVTKIMTLLLVMEAIEDGKINYTDMVSASEHACSMGGSQIFLEVGEQMSVDDLLKSVVIASANDAAVTLAEYVAGTEAAFVEMMNSKAAELGMENTHFENTNGLDDTTQNHVTSAKDIAIMSRELIKHAKITEYSSIWMDTIRNGEFGLTNTNRLIRFYKGATGLKTGSTAKAGFCVSATAERDGMTLIAVIMGAKGRDERNRSAVALLNYGFSNYALYRNSERQPVKIPVVKGKNSFCIAEEEELVAVIEKRQSARVERKVDIAERIYAPIKSGEQVGTVMYSVQGKVIGTSKMITTQGVEQIGFFDVFLRMIAKMTFC